MNAMGPLEPTFIGSLPKSPGSGTLAGAWNWIEVELIAPNWDTGAPFTSTAKNGVTLNPDPVMVIVVPAGPWVGDTVAITAGDVPMGVNWAWRMTGPTAPALPSTLTKYLVPPVRSPNA